MARVMRIGCRRRGGGAEDALGAESAYWRRTWREEAIKAALGNIIGAGVGRRGSTLLKSHGMREGGDVTWAARNASAACCAGSWWCAEGLGPSASAPEGPVSGVRIYAFQNSLSSRVSASREPGVIALPPPPTPLRDADMCPDDADDDAAECEPRLERERSGRDELHASLLTPFHPSGVRVVQRPRFGRKPILPSPQWRGTASHRSRAQPGRGGSSRFMSPKADENSGCRRSCGGMGAEVAGGVVQDRSPAKMCQYQYARLINGEKGKDKGNEGKEQIRSAFPLSRS
ncbi:hypothetical protein B0H19DRAFT_1086122 [Mycena capillaripes]|nr:hypothetical protein B0H19DRAFT_1086122 [Mycena capillaripes]